MSGLPIEQVLPEITARLAEGGNLVLVAPPGAGKTTRVPLALLDAPWLAGAKVIMLEPRRLAARAAARRMAASLGEAVGATVGYRVRNDRRVGPATRIEVVTDGLFTRLIQGDPELAGVGAVLFDEFHERSLDGDLGLALALETQAALRPDLRLLVMSATLDAQAVAGLLRDAPVVVSEGRMFPVETRYRGPRADEAIEAATTRAILDLLAEEAGSQLVFLPGQGEIRRVEASLRDRLPPDVTVCPLFGELAPAQQDAAIRAPEPGQRKVVLATSIAETSLTIEGVRVVIDSGRARLPRFDPGSGMSRLATVPLSRASADQRRGRAGRLEPGMCIRLWTEAAHRMLPAQTPAEILEADLAPLVLELAAWGARDPGDLAWIDPPPAAAWAQATELLARLGAIDASGAITQAGRRMSGLGLHPRLAHMVLEAEARGLGALAAQLAAVLGERDFLRPDGPGAWRDADLRLRVELLAAERPRAPAGLLLDRGALDAARKVADDLMRRLRVQAKGSLQLGEIGLLTAFAFPDRIGQRRSGDAARFRLSGGRGAHFRRPDPLGGEAWLAIADLDGDAREAQIFRAAPVEADALREAFADQLETRAEVVWDDGIGAVVARRQVCLGALVLEDRPWSDPPPGARVAALLGGIRLRGMEALPWTSDLRAWRARVAFAATIENGLPDLSDGALMETMADWLGPHLEGVTRWQQITASQLGDALHALLPWDRARALDTLAPTHWEVPSGSRIPIDYAGERPVLAVRLQEMFGARETPRLGGVPLLLHLLSPARRPVQVTADLPSFWATTYEAVRKDLRGQYPRHYWPDDPLVAEATARAKPRGR